MARSRTPAASQEPSAEEAIEALVRRAEGGDKEALRALRPLYAERPDWMDLVGSFTQQAIQSWLVATYGEKNLFAIESTRQKMKAMRAELEGPAPSPLERLLVDRILVTWVQLGYAETGTAQQWGGMNEEARERAEQRMGRAQRRFLEAIRGLAQIRRLAVPLVQVNVVQQQMQVAQEGLTNGRQAHP